MSNGKPFLARNETRLSSEAEQCSLGLPAISPYLGLGNHEWAEVAPLVLRSACQYFLSCYFVLRVFYLHGCTPLECSTFGGQNMASDPPWDRSYK